MVECLESDLLAKKEEKLLKNLKVPPPPESPHSPLSPDLVNLDLKAYVKKKSKHLVPIHNWIKEHVRPHKTNQLLFPGHKLNRPSYCLSTLSAHP